MRVTMKAMMNGLEEKGEKRTTTAPMTRITTIALRKTHVKAIEPGEMQHVVLVVAAAEEVHLIRVRPHPRQAQAAHLTASRLLCLQPPLAMTMMAAEVVGEAVGAVVEDATIAQVDVAVKEKQKGEQLGI